MVSVSIEIIYLKIYRKAAKAFMHLNQIQTQRKVE